MLRRIDGLLWSPATADAGTVEVLARTEIRPFAHLRPQLHDERLDRRMAECNTWPQQEYVHRITGDLLLDPDTGFVLPGGLRYLPDSLPYAYQANRPSTGWILLSRTGLLKTLTFDRVISFRDVNEHNYFHFLHDVLTKVPLLRSMGLLDAPVVIGQGLHGKRFFQDVKPRLTAAGLEVVEQGDRVVRAREVVLCKSMPFARPHLDGVLDLLGAPRTSGSGDRKVFLMRSRANTRERLIANWAEVEALVRDLGFEVIDAATLSLPQQMELLGATRWLVVVHGAAATNMIFRRGRAMDVLELFPEESVPPHYYWLSHTMGHTYHGVIGGASDRHGAFQFPLPELRRALQRMLSVA